MTVAFVVIYCIIDYLENAGNYCVCVKPCHQQRFIPTTSFSIVLTPKTLEGNEDEKTFAMRTNLKKANEIRYRVVDTHYQATLKVKLMIVLYSLDLSTFSHILKVRF